jgi:hypothetical protein
VSNREETLPQITVPVPGAAVTERRLRWSWLLFLAVAGCQGSGTSTFTLGGDWQISYSLIDSTACAVGAVPHPTCSGAGAVHLTQDGQTLEGTYDVPGGCETCAEALDYVPAGLLADGRVADGVVEFTLHGCRFSADLPPPGSKKIEGTTTCTLSGSIALRGAWVMTRPAS